MELSSKNRSRGHLPRILRHLCNILRHPPIPTGSTESQCDGTVRESRLQGRFYITREEG